MTTIPDAPHCRRRGGAALHLITTLVLAGSAPALALAPGELAPTLTFPVSNLADTAFGVALDPDGGIVIAGYGKAGAEGVLARATTGGVTDSGFGTSMNGIIEYNLSASLNDNLGALARTSDGHYVACGTIFDAGTATDFLTVKFKSDGTLDGTFNGVGWAFTPYLASGSGAALYDQCNAVGVQSDGKVISAGYTSADGAKRVMVTRHTTAGALDGMFAGGGKTKIDASLGAAADSSIQAMIVLPNDKLLLAGNAGGMFNYTEFLLMRLNADGSPDAGFGSNGIVRQQIGTSANGIAYAIALQPNGYIVLAGSAIAADGRNDFALARFDASGNPDMNFGSSGVVTTPIGPGEDIAYAVAVMPWGRIVAAGSARISTSAAGTDIAIAAYNADGSLDKYFGTGGKVMAEVGVAPDELINALVADVPHERVWAVGAIVPINNRDFAAFSFGLPDTIFRDGFQGP